MTSEQFGATPEEINEYGAGLNLWQSLALLQQWAPLISYGRDFVNEVDPYKKSIIVANGTRLKHADAALVAGSASMRELHDTINPSAWRHRTHHGPTPFAQSLPFGMLT